MFKKTLIILGLSITLNGCSNSTFSILPNQSTATIQDQWTSYQQIKFRHWNINSQDYYAFILDDKSLQLKIVENPASLDQQESLEEIHHEHQSLFSFNGSFYNEKFQPTGLLISEGKKRSELVRADLLNGVFLIDQNGQPTLMTYQEYKDLRPAPQFAVQNGPILIDQQGKIAIADRSNKPANRTAIGLTSDQKIIVIFCRNSILNQNNSPTLYQFANTVKNSSEFSDLGIHSLLNLDGGPSTSFAIKDEVYPEQLEKVENVIIVKTPHDV